MRNDARAHEPTREFRAALESEIVRTFRQQEAARRARFRAGRFRIAALVVLSLGVGGATGIVYGQVQDARRRDVLVEARSFALQSAGARLVLVRAALEEAQQRFDIGIESRTELAAVRAELREAELRYRRLELEIEEIRASGIEPRDDLTAPLIAARDFVTERLQLDLVAAREKLALAQESLNETERRIRIGALPEPARIDLDAELAHARYDVDRISQLLALRQQFVENRITAEDVGIQANLIEAQLDFALATELHALAQRRRDNVNRLHAVGQVTELDRMRAEVEVLERSLEAQMAQRQLRALQAARDSVRP